MRIWLRMFFWGRHGSLSRSCEVTTFTKPGKSYSAQNVFWFSIYYECKHIQIRQLFVNNYSLNRYKQHLYFCSNFSFLSYDLHTNMYKPHTSSKRHNSSWNTGIVLTQLQQNNLNFTRSPVYIKDKQPYIYLELIENEYSVVEIRFYYLINFRT